MDHEQEQMPKAINKRLQCKTVPTSLRTCILFTPAEIKESMI